MNDKGVLEKYNIDELDFSYRYSSFHKFKGIIVSATLKLKKTENINIKILRNLDIRKKTQPLNEKTIGCIFKNPKDGSAAYLIDKAGLKNFQIGGAKISEKHANFIVNCKNAKTNDVIKLIGYVKDKVKDNFNILLEEEIRYFSND